MGAEKNFLYENDLHIVKNISRILLWLLLALPGMLLFIMSGQFYLSYGHFFWFAAIAGVVMCLPTVMLKKNASIGLMKQVTVLAPTIVLGLMATEIHVVLYLTLGMGIALSLFYHDKKLTFRTAIETYCIIVVSVGIRSLFVEGEPRLHYFLATCFGYLMEIIAMGYVCTRIADDSRDMLEKMYLAKVKEEAAEQQAQEGKERLQRVTQQVIQALSGTVDAKDRYTNGHSMRVAGYAAELSRRMGMDQQYQENIYYTGMLHDIGKIGVPDEIINKPGKLTDQEYDLIKTHPDIGSQIVKNISEVPGLYEGTRGHHERYDGRGYPDGLAGEKIPLIARIIAVADSYDAMTSHRSYRSPLPQQVVREEIQKGRGSQFDPAIADIMLGMIDEDTEYTMHE